jgi:hypothetical protein
MNKTRKPRMSADLRAFLRKIEPLRRIQIPGMTIVEWGKRTLGLCMKCGATGKQILLLKHKPGCAYVALTDAREVLDGKLRELEGSLKKTAMVAKWGDGTWKLKSGTEQHVARLAKDLTKAFSKRRSK